MAVCTNIAYATDFITFKRSSQSDIELTRTSDTITYDPLDWKGVRMAVENLRHDLKAVTGSANAPVVVATIGKSKLAKKYKLQSKELQGKWEQYLIFTDKGKLVILGSDKRGTIFGIYELSRQPVNGCVARFSTTSDGSASISTYLQQAIIPLKLL